MTNPRSYTAFVGQHRIGSGPLEVVLAEVRQNRYAKQGAPVLMFEDWSGRQVDFDFVEPKSPATTMVEETTEPRTVGRGRPRLGVVSREISLLPRHWEWLEQNPSGASAALRRIVDEAIKRHGEEERLKRARETTARFMTAMAGNLAGYEEATRALYAGQAERFFQLIGEWPTDIREYATSLAHEAFAGA